MAPPVTVLMSVHNGMPFLREAVESIRAQTFRDFEFLILDDASTDGTADYLASLRDERARIIALRENIGLTAALNHGLREARGEFVARQDADDWSDPRRLELQLQALNKYPDCAAVGSQARLIDGGGRSLGKKNFPLEPASIRFAHLFDNALAHSAVTFRRAIVQNTGGYDPAWPASQDYELWSRLSERAELRNVPERLVTLRVLESSITRQHRRPELIRRVQAAHFQRVFGRPAADEELDVIGFARSQVPPARIEEFRALFASLVGRFVERNPSRSQAPDFRRTLALLHERVGYNLLTVARGSACKELWAALQAWPRSAFEMPWMRIAALAVMGDGIRRLYEKLAR